MAGATDARVSSIAPGSVFGNGQSVGIGSLPHRDADAAASFSLAEFGVPTVPALPRRSPAESLIAQALLGMPGVSEGPYGSIAVDPAHAADDTAIETDLGGDAFVGLDAFCELARRIGHDGSPVKWQFVGPVTLGVALRRAGLDEDHAFDVALRTVRQHLAAMSAALTSALPASPQMVVLEEPALDQLMDEDFPVPPDEAVDKISGAMAALPASSLRGVHSSGAVDLATMLATGPSVISIAVHPRVADWAGYLARYIDEGGLIAWGVLPDGGPVPMSSGRSWRQLSDLWCELVRRGCDPVRLRRQALVTPTIGLGSYSEGVARRLARITADVATQVADQANATRFALGA
jgi:hypothetical protein